MNVKRYLLAAFALFVFIFLYEWLLHGFLLMDLYQETSNVWRDFKEMDVSLPLVIFFQFVLAVWAAFVFTRFYKEGGWKNGLLFGFYFGVFAGILTASWYLWLPVQSALAWGWFLGGVGEGVGGGLIIGSIYRNR